MSTVKANLFIVFLLFLANASASAGENEATSDMAAEAAMGINPDWIGYLGYSTQAGLGQGDLSKIEIRGAKVADVTRKYKMHDDLERELRWQGPMKGIPEKLG